MKILIDDLRQPIDPTWTVLRNPAEAIRFLDMYCLEVTDIQLDHDNTHFITLEGTNVTHPFPCVCTFALVARYIERLGQVYPDWKPNIVLKTLNPIGAEDMKQILKSFTVEVRIEA